MNTNSLYNDGPLAFCGSSRTLLVDAGAFRQDLRCYKDQQLRLVRRRLPRFEQVTDRGYVSEERHFRDRFTALGFVYSAENHGLAVADENLGLDDACVDTRYEAAGGAGDEVAHGVVTHQQVHDDVVVRSDLRRDGEAQYRLLELRRRCSGRRRF